MIETKERQKEKVRQQRGPGFYVISLAGVVLTLALAIVVILFWQEIQRAQAYGYSGGFVISILGGVTVIPVPSLLITFTLGSVLNPVWVGLISGFGEAIGGITVYLTGAGVGTIWMKLRSKEAREQTPEEILGTDYIGEPLQPHLWSKGQAFYNRLAKWLGGKGGMWVLFFSSMIIISPFYFAGLAAGSVRMGLMRFFLVSWAGKTIKGLTVAFAGYYGLGYLLRWIGV